MTKPIRVYPTEAPGLYKTEDGRIAQRYTPWPGFFTWCVRCTQFLSTDAGAHWLIGQDSYCRHCVIVAGEAGEEERP